MQGLFSRTVMIVVLCVVVLLASLAGATVAAKEGNKERGDRVICSGLSCAVGLALDSRGNIYTADSETGHVYCVPQGSSPVLLAKVPDTPAALAVDKLRNVFVGTDSGVIYMVSLDGSVAEAYRCTSRPIGLDIDRDGGLVVVTEEGDILRVKRAEFRLR